MSPARPKMIGTCKIEDALGKGGMAEVFVGIQEPLERRVAIKTLLPDMAGNKEAVERFRREALALATLQHENIVGVYDLVEKYNRLYMVMEFVDGVDLAEVIKEGRVPLDIGLLIGSELASALEHAHFRKLLHRDIKPANVMLSRSGQVKLTDFGIAKDQTKNDLTREGFVVGTPSYLSPEQVMGKGADWRSDIYALGVLLFEILSGQRPWIGDTTAKLLGSIVKGQHLELRRCAPHLPKSVEKIVHRCLLRDPEKRYQRAADVHRDVDRLLSRLLKTSPSARVVSFLRDLGKIQENDMTVIDSSEVAAATAISGTIAALDSNETQAVTRGEEIPLLRRLARLALLVVLVVAVLVATLYVTYLIAPEWTQQLLEQMADWMESKQVE